MSFLVEYSSYTTIILAVVLLFLTYILYKLRQNDRRIKSRR